MKITLLVIGKTSSRWIAEGTETYLKRLVHYVPTDVRVLPDLRSTRGLSELQQKEQEGRMILDALQPGDVAVLLDERGKELTSREFAGMIEKRMNGGVRQLTFVVGGPYGFSQAVYDRADAMLSMSRMTFSHEMIRAIFVEQLYRAMTILRGEPYHHD